jgi:hypothetical protein
MKAKDTTSRVLKARHPLVSEIDATVTPDNEIIGSFEALPNESGEQWLDRSCLQVEFEVPGLEAGDDDLLV